MSEYELYHHGILGMHWGIRRYQNKDGSLTAAGKLRYQQLKNGWKTEKDLSKFERKIQQNSNRLGVENPLTDIHKQEYVDYYRKNFNQLRNEARNNDKYAIDYLERTGDEWDENKTFMEYERWLKDPINWKPTDDIPNDLAKAISEDSNKTARFISDAMKREYGSFYGAFEKTKIKDLSDHEYDALDAWLFDWYDRVNKSAEKNVADSSERERFVSDFIGKVAKEYEKTTMTYQEAIDYLIKHPHARTWPNGQKIPQGFK